jgi:hypothetical protein
MSLPKEFVSTLGWLLPCAGPYSGNILNLGLYPTEKYFRETEIKSKAMREIERERPNQNNTSRI